MNTVENEQRSPCLLRGKLLVRSTVGSHRIASSFELSRTAPHRRPARHHFTSSSSVSKRQPRRKLTHSPLSPAHTAHSRMQTRTRRGARRRGSLTGALRLCRPPRFPPFRPASSLFDDGPSGALVRWRVAGGCAVCLRCGVVVWKCCSDAARVVQDARVLRDEMR
jgi:hypothetical protein